MIIIIGAGLIGLSIGNELLDYGYEVNIFDFKKKGEASGAAVGMLAPLIEAKPYEEELFQLMQESKSIWFNHSRDLEKQSDLVTGYIENSALLIAKDADEFEKLKFKQNFIKRIGHDTKLLDKSQTLEIEPLLSENIYASLYCEGQSQVNPILLKKALVNSFLKKGGSIFGKKSINKLVLKNNKVGVSLRNEVSFASNIIIAAGVWSYQLLLNSFGINIPIKPIKGVSMRVKQLKTLKKIKNNLWFNNIYIAPRNNRELVVGATEDEKGFVDKINVGEIYYLTKNLWESLAFADEFQILAFNSGLRPASYDGLPVIGQLDIISDKIICAFGHFRHGVLLSPITAKIISKIVRGTKIKNLYKSFSPNRFNLKN